MRQLNSLDTAFLATETDEVHSHTGGVVLLDASETPDFGYERLLDFLRERIPSVAKFQWKLQEVPLGLDRPYWVEDPSFDVRNHLRHIALPAGSGLRELTELCAQLFAVAIPRDRPLWEMWLIEGLGKGRCAILFKMHHCMMDGQALNIVGQVLCDLEPGTGDAARTPKAPESPVEPEKPGEAPGLLGLTFRAANHLAWTPYNFARKALEVFSPSSLPSSLGGAAPVPKVVFNGRIGPRRGFSCTKVSLGDVKRVRKHFGATVNDVVLAITSSAMRRYLEKVAELPEDSMVIMVPVSTRADSNTDANNQASVVNVPWFTDIADPAKRLMAIHRHMDEEKDAFDDLAANPLELFGELPPGVTGLLARNVLGPLLARGTGLPANNAVSNVRGSPLPLYTAGARIEAMYPMSLISPGLGLNITAVSYMDDIDFGFTTAPEAVPDPWLLAEGVGLGLAELVDLLPGD
ncbi:MAG: wax ester/triacylglycerol synthase family O-acyltransferase [Deltaproteobacteria bacterium]|nr:wax ester/triacylglycerol synthase family O-acyltransferase [Deltaproteobacteria bacterium]